MENNEVLAQIRVGKHMVKGLLSICINQTSFRHIGENIHVHVDVVLMGICLDTIFAEFSMCDHEIRVFAEISGPKPKPFCN